MKSQISVPVDTKTFVALCDFLREANDPRDPVEIFDLAVWYWMDNASWKPELLRQTDTNGYQWKNVFLPAGTQIRMQYRGKYFYAQVDGDQVVFDGEPITPSALANKITMSSRNAWRDLWIKRPKDDDWKLAQDLRGAPKSAQEMLDELGQGGE